MIERRTFGGYLINWIGGKRQLREAVSKPIPENITSYIEPFGGGGWVLFYYQKWAELEVYNDLDGRLVNLFRVVKYHPCELAREMCYLLYSREQFLTLSQTSGETDIQRAARFMFLLSRSFGGKGKSFGVSYSCSIKSAGGLIERIDRISKRLDRVIIENLSAMELIQRYDLETAFFYCDPPYSSGAGYEVVSTAKFKHEQLCDVLKNIKGRFLLSYDDSARVRELYKDFNIIEISRANGINRKNIRNNVYNELLICNYDVEISGDFYRVKSSSAEQGSFLMFKIDTKDLKKLTDNLRKCSKSAYPLTVRSTLNRMAFETSNTAKKDVLPKVFTLRNKYIQGTVGYKRCDNTFNIASMSSYAGQVSEWKGKPTGQLEKQEYGKPVFAKGKHTFVATPTARGGSYNKLILKSFRFSNLNVYKPHQLVKNPTLDPHKEIPQAIAFAEKYKRTFAVIAYSPVYLRYGIFGIKPTGKIGRASMLYTLEDKKTTIKRHEWLRTSMNNTLSKADEIFEDEAIKRIEKIMSQGLKSK